MTPEQFERLMEALWQIRDRVGYAAWWLFLTWLLLMGIMWRS